jgi:aspartate/methionine/tyrosine aminotransferase
MPQEFHTNPEDIASATQRANTFNFQLLERLRERSKKAVNGSHGNPGGKQYLPISTAVGKAVFDGKSMSIYRNSAGEKTHMEKVASYFSQLGVAQEIGEVTVDNIVPGYGVTNLYALILPKIKADYHKKHPTKKPVIMMTSPCYGLYTVQPEDCDLPIVTVPLREKNGWKLQAADLEVAIAKAEATGDKKVAPFYNMNPHNPTGAILDVGEMAKIADVFKKHDVFVIDDMIYHGTEYGEAMAKPFAAIPGMFNRSITLLGLSKAFCTPSIRAAAACGRPEDIDYLKARNSALLGSIGLPSQVALSAALSSDSANKEERSDYWHRNNKNYIFRYKLLHALVEGSDAIPVSEDERKEYVALVQKYHSVKKADAEKIVQEGIPGLRLANNPESGYFALMDFSGLKGKFCGKVRLENSTVIAAALADYGKTMVLPSGYMLAGKEHPMMARISYAMEPESIVRMLRGLRQAVEIFTDRPNPSIGFDLNNPVRDDAPSL